MASNDKISNMTAAVVGDILGSAGRIEMTKAYATAPVTLGLDFATLRTSMFAGSTGYTATDPITAGAASFTTLAASGNVDFGGGKFTVTAASGLVEVARAIANADNSDGLLVTTTTSATVNGSYGNYGISSQITAQTVSAGVTDSGARVAITGDAYAAIAGFAGTLATQTGIRGRAGIGTATAGAVVTTAYGGYFEIKNAVASTTITTAYGVYIANSETVGTIGTRWDLYCSSTNANSFFAGGVQIDGKVAIGTTINAAVGLNVNPSPVGASQYGLGVTPRFGSDATTFGRGLNIQLFTATAAYTMTDAMSIFIADANKGAGSTITNLYGLYIDPQTGGGTLNYAIYTNAGLVRFGGAVTCASTLAITGALTGVTTLSTSGAINGQTISATAAFTGSLAITGALTGVTDETASGFIKSTGATAGIGYATGAGGAVTQITSRTTGVTLNTVCGAITLVSAAGSATPATFTVTNSAVAATDVIKLNQKSGTDLYVLLVTAVAAGSFNITFYTTGGTTTETPVFNFAVLKGVAA